MKKYFCLGVIFCLLVIRSAQAEATDTDQDGLSDEQEAIYLTQVDKADTDNDGFNDGLEVKNGFSPLQGKKAKLRDVDTDKDGLNDAWEAIIGSGLDNADTDADDHQDGEEVRNGFDPLLPDRAVDKLIAVDLKTQRLEYFFDGKKLDSFLISSGLKSMPTPKGEFKVLAKMPSKTYGGQGYNFYYPNTKWNLHFTTAKNGLRYYIHGAYWHKNFGHPMSHGCVNVSYDNMEDLYDWAQVGTKILIK